MFTGNVCLILRLMFWLGVVLGATFAVAEERQTACGGTGTALAAAIEPLKALCPSPSSATSPECIEALDEHWLDPDGTEHWIELDGTEWILLPPEPPHVE